MSFIITVLYESWHIFVESSVYIMFGLLISGLLRIFLTPDSVGQHFGTGRFISVFKAALFGIPIPLCSCGVLPAAVTLKKQGANNGATTAFLISTPESGIDSISITYALLGPVMTVARPVAAFITASVAGLVENIFNSRKFKSPIVSDLICSVDSCCKGGNCSQEEHKPYYTLTEKIIAGFRYAFGDVWSDMAGWFFAGVVLAGLIMTIIPDNFFGRYLGGGLSSMLLMLAIGIPVYICATASTPIAAAMILKGISPGAALVFLLAGPATNITSLTVLLGVLGKRTTGIFLFTIALFSVIFGLMLDQVYELFGFSVSAMAGDKGEIIPLWAKWTGAFALLSLSAKPVFRSVKSLFIKLNSCGHQTFH